jgi:nucleotide-binding universal stress UspA family protein
MATRGRAGLQRALAGSVAENVLEQISAPLLLIKPGGKRLMAVRTLLGPVDGTAGGALALGAAVELAQATGAKLELVRVVEPLPLWTYTGGMGLAPAGRGQAVRKRSGHAFAGGWNPGWRAGRDGHGRRYDQCHCG